MSLGVQVFINSQNFHDVENNFLVFRSHLKLYTDKETNVIPI